MNNDIVKRLRNTGGLDKKLHGESADEIERVRNERDEARRTICEYVARQRSRPIPVNGLASGLAALLHRSIKPETVALELNWDCFGGTNGN